ncbi:MAG: hypothetical protein ABUL60_07245 [Myxococcales bacterium]
MTRRCSLLTSSLAFMLCACSGQRADDTATTREALTSTLVTQPAAELSPEVPVGENEAVPSAAAFNGDVFLTVWTQPSLVWPGSDLYGARLAKNGTLLDPGGFKLCTNCTYGLDYGNLSPTIGATPGRFLVIWEAGWATILSDGTATVHSGDIVPEGLPDAPGSALLDYPAVSCSPQECLLVWYDGGGSILGSVLAPDGQQLSENVRLLGCGQPPALAWKGREALVTCDGKAVRVLPDGDIISGLGQPFTLSGNGLAAVASNGDGYLVSRGETVPIDPINALRVDGSGVVLDVPALTVGDFGDFGPVRRAFGLFHPFTVVGSHAGSYKVLWQHSFTGSLGEPEVSLQSSEVSANGTVSGPTDVAVSSQMDGIAIAASPDGYLLVWGGGPAGTGDRGYPNITPHTLFLGDSGERVETQIVGGPPLQSDPAVAHSSSDYLVAWAEPQSGGIFSARNASIFSARVAANGQLIDSTPLLLGTGPGRRGTPSVASDGTDFAIVWDDTANGSDDVFAAAVSSLGAVSPSASIASGATSQTNPGVASNGSGYFATWEEPDGIHGARLTPELTVDGSPALVAAGRADGGGTTAATLASVASNGTSYLVVWVDAGSARTVYGARVAADGTVVDPSGFPIGAIAAGERPRVTWDGASYLVVWKGATGAEGSLHAASVSESGAVTAVELTSAAAASAPSVGMLCGSPFVVWQETAPLSPADVFGVLVPAAASFVTPIAATSANEAAPVVSGRQTEALAAFVNDGRVYARIVTASPCGGSVEPGGGAGGAGGASDAGAAGETVGGTLGMGGTLEAGAGGTLEAGNAGVAGTGGTLEGGNAGVAGTGGTPEGGSAGSSSAGKGGKGGGHAGGAPGGHPHSGCSIGSPAHGGSPTASLALLALLGVLGRRAYRGQPRKRSWQRR